MLKCWNQTRQFCSGAFQISFSLVDLFGQNWPKSIQVQPTRSGVPTMSVQDGSTTVHVHSTVQPIVEAERWLRAPLARDWDFAVVFGMGMGYHLDALLEERPQCRLVVVEPRTDVFFVAIATRDQRRLLSHPYLELIVTDDPVHGATAYSRTISGDSWVKPQCMCGLRPRVTLLIT